MLRRIERNLESLVEGVFGRTFRSPVQPVDIARKLAKEMDENKAVSISRVYAPNEYLLYLSPQDRAQYHQYEEALLQEFSTYLLEHADRQGYALLSRPRILIEEDPDLDIGLFGIATRMVEPERSPQPDVTPPSTAEPKSSNQIPSPSNNPLDQPITEDSSEEQTSPPINTSFSLIIGGARHKVESGQAILGRSKKCDIVINDGGASRQHARIHRDGEAWIASDLESTNGFYVNGKRISRAVLTNGDTLSIGRTQMRFEC